MWLAGFAELPDWLVAKVGEVVGQPLQSAVAGCALSKACGRESPQAVALLAIIPTYGALSWQVWQAATAAATVVWPATESVGAVRLAAPSLKPPALTLLVVWQPEPLQSRLLTGKWLAGMATRVMVVMGGGPAEGWVVGPW